MTNRASWAVFVIGGAIVSVIVAPDWRSRAFVFLVITVPIGWWVHRQIKRSASLPPSMGEGSGMGVKPEGLAPEKNGDQV